MAVRMRLSRRGKKNDPFYHVVVADERKARDGRFIEVVGIYDPQNKESRFKGNKERIEHWLGKGALPTATVSKLIRTMQS